MTLKNLKVSIIVCTHNGALTISQCLSSLKKQNYPSQKYEVIVIDNASTDNTKRLIKNVQYVYEAKLGLSIARNRGIKQAKGEIVAFIDDDALADKNWLKHLVSQFKTKKIWAVGGQVKPKYQVKPPNWLPKKYLFALSICHLGSTIKSVPDIIGTNMAFRKTIFSQIGYFNPRLGRRANKLFSSEEIDLCQRITKANGKIIYTPHAIVRHLVSKQRLTKRFFTLRIFFEGVSLARMDKENINFNKRFRRLIFHRSRALITALIKLLIYRRFTYWCDFLLNLGYFSGFFPA